MWYKIFMLIMVPALAIAWLAYYLYMRKVCQEEKKMPKPHLQKTRSEVADWAKKMAEYQPPKPPKSWQQGQDNRGDSDQSAS